MNNKLIKDLKTNYDFDASNLIDENNLSMKQIGNDFVFEFYNTIPIIKPILSKTFKNYIPNKKNIIFSTSNNFFGKNVLDFLGALNNSFTCLFYSKNNTETIYERLYTTTYNPNIDVISINGDYSNIKNDLKKIIDENCDFTFNYFDEFNYSVLYIRALYLLYVQNYLIKQNILKENESFNIFIPNEDKTYIDAIKLSVKFGLNVNNILLCNSDNINEINHIINDTYKEYKYVLSPYAASCFQTKEKYKIDTNDKKINVVLSLSSPYIYAKTICEAIRSENFNDIENPDFFIEDLSILMREDIPNVFKNLYSKPILHYDVINYSDLQYYITKLLLNL